MVLEPKYHVYYARVRIDGKIYQRSLEEKVFSRAKLLLPDKLKEIRDSVMRTVDVSRFSNEVTFEEVAQVASGGANVGSFWRFENQHAAKGGGADCNGGRSSWSQLVA